MSRTEGIYRTKEIFMLTVTFFYIFLAVKPLLLGACSFKCDDLKQGFIANLTYTHKLKLVMICQQSRSDTN